MATGVDIQVDGKAVKGVSGYSVSEESTPIDPSDSTGATGYFSFSFFSDLALAAKRMRRKIVGLQDKGQGTTEGIARVPSFQSGTMSLSVDLRTTLLAVTRTAQPFDGMLGDYFTYLLGLVGITSGYVVDSTLASIHVTYPGWNGEVWLQMKKMLTAVGAEVSLVSDNVVLRPLRGRVTIDNRNIDLSWASDDTGLALSVEGYYYNNTQRTNYLAYPDGGWNENVQVYQVDSGETLVFDLPLSASLSSVQQPVAMDYVDRYEESASVYCVMSNDGYPFTAAEWVAEGGSVSVKISEDTKSLSVTIVGATNSQYAPFRIAATAGPSDNYSSLRILGTGVFFDKQLVTVPTAIPTDLASQEVGATVDNEFISSKIELYDRLIWTLARYGGSRQTLTVKTTGINRAGDSGSYAYPTIAEFNAQAVAAGWSDIADFNAAAGVAGWSTIADFNAAQFATVQNSFVNQAFGNVAGARTLRDDMWWRIRTATIAPDSITYTAEADTTIADFNAVWSNGVSTIAQFNAEHAGDTISDFDVAPLERSA